MKRSTSTQVAFGAEDASAVVRLLTDGRLFTRGVESFASGIYLRPLRDRFLALHVAACCPTEIVVSFSVFAVSSAIFSSQFNKRLAECRLQWSSAFAFDGVQISEEV